MLTRHAKAMDTDGDDSFSLQEFTRVVVERVVADSSSGDTGGTTHPAARQYPIDTTSAPAPEPEPDTKEKVCQISSCLSSP